MRWRRSSGPSGQVALLGLLVACAASCVTGTRSPRRKAARFTIDRATLAKLRARAPTLARRHAAYPGVFSLLDQRLQHHWSGFWWYEDDLKRHYLLLDPRNQSLSTLRFRTRKGQQLSYVELAILRPDGSFSRYGKKHLLVDRQDNGDVHYRFVYPRVSAGCVIAERIIKRYPNAYAYRSRLALHQIWLQGSLPIEQFALRYIHPQNWGLAFKHRSDLPRLKERRYGRHFREMSYRRKNVPPLPAESYTAPRKRDGMQLVIYVHDMAAYARTSLPLGWKSYAKYLRYHYLEAQGLPWAYLRWLARRVVARAKRGREAKQQALLAYVQRSFRRLYKDRSGGDIREVLRQGAGTRLQLTQLTYYLLRSIDLPVDFVMLHDAQDGLFDADFVTPLELDIPALILSKGRRGCLAFPWIRALPCGLVPTRYQGQKALRLPTRGGRTVFVTQRAGPEKRLTEDRYQIWLGDDGRIRVELREWFYGFEARRWRLRLLGQTAAQRKRLLRRRVIGRVRARGLVTTLRGAVGTPGQPVSIDSRYELHGARHRRGNLISFRLFPFRAPLELNLLSREKRHRPLTITAAKRFERRATIRFPSHWKLVGGPERRRQHGPFGELSVKVARGAGELKITQRLTLNRVRRPATDVAVLGRLHAASQRHFGLTLTFRSAPDPQPTTRPPPTTVAPTYPALDPGIPHPANQLPK